MEKELNKEDMILNESIKIDTELCLDDTYFKEMSELLETEKINQLTVLLMYNN